MTAKEIEAVLDLADKNCLTNVAYWQILLQKSKVAGRPIFRENPKREALADSYDLNRITEVACEFNVRR
jgi:hypothetical protein